MKSQNYWDRQQTSAFSSNGWEGEGEVQGWGECDFKEATLRILLWWNSFSSWPECGVDMQTCTCDKMA